MSAADNSFKNRTAEKPFPKRVDVNIWLDSLDELFSDFDPRSYAKRTVSDDFILQVKKITAEQKGEKTILYLQLPEANRNQKEEEIISGRLHLYFSEKYQQLLHEKKNKIWKSTVLIACGIALMIISSYIIYQDSDKYFLRLLLILFEPAGWFTLWLGLDRLTSNYGTDLKEMNFYKRMTEAQIKFSTI